MHGFPVVTCWENPGLRENNALVTYGMGICCIERATKVHNSLKDQLRNLDCDHDQVNNEHYILQNVMSYYVVGFVTCRQVLTV